LDRTLWLRVDLSRESGVTHTMTDGLLRALTARAAGHMQALVLYSVEAGPFPPALLELLQVNSASFREETTAPFEQSTYLDYAEVMLVLHAAPQLRALRSNMDAPVREAARMLRNEAPFEPLRVRYLHVENEPEPWGADEDDEDEDAPIDGADLLALADAMRQHACLEGVWLQDVPLDTPAVLDAFIDAALTRGLSHFIVKRCSLSPASVPALVRLLHSTTLACLTVAMNRQQLLDAAAAALLADALRANTTLHELWLDGVFFWSDAGAAVVTALIAHPSLQQLHLTNNHVQVDDAAAVGAALGALIAANAPALRVLSVSWCQLGDAGLAPLMNALPRNTHLCKLHCKDNAMSDAFARDCILPAVRANTSLRVLSASGWWGGDEDGAAPDEVLQAEALVKARADADAAAAAAAA
jgi:hypothetical protein